MGLVRLGPKGLGGARVGWVRELRLGLARWVGWMRKFKVRVAGVGGADGVEGVAYELRPGEELRGVILGRGPRVAILPGPHARWRGGRLSPGRVVDTVMIRPLEGSGGGGVGELVLDWVAGSSACMP